MFILYCVITAVVWGMGEMLYKAGARENESNSHLKTAVLVGIALGLHAIFTLLVTDINYNPINIVMYLPVSFFYILAMIIAYFGYKFLEDSIVAPINNSGGSIAAILCAIFLKETLNIPSIIGIFLIGFGIISIGFIESRRETKKNKTNMRVVSVILAVIYAFLDSVGELLDAMWLDIETTHLVGVTENNIEMVANTSYELTFLILAGIFGLYLFLKHDKLDIKNQKAKIGAAVLEVVGQYTYIYAMSGKASVAAPIISSTCIFSMLFAHIFLKEKLTVKEYISIFIVIVGIFILSIYWE